ncbi:small kinetochore-associated protein [Mixophyes fleayi]|uniref:small kinetochore-associated protein n=1 Tax=Mixophyes fleayi TaxID=3061075 RepID=UPI003F4D8502
MEKSKLPVLRPQATNRGDLMLPCAKKPCLQKPVLTVYSKDPNIAFSSNASGVGVFKTGGNGKKAVLPKKTVPHVRGPVNRYRMETELRDKNQLLEAANTSLHSSLVSAQNKIKEMTEQYDEVKEDLKELKWHLEKNMIILESRNIDPVSGEHIIAAAAETRKMREETTVVTENLLKELKLFSLTAAKQKNLMQTITTKWKEAEDSRNVFLEEQQAFQSDMEQFRSSLKETQKWLDL